VGRGTYTSRTFSPERYNIWYNRSDFHNIPTVNGQTQPPGSEFKATEVSYKAGSSFAQFSLNIAPSYPEAAGISRWQRTVRLNRGKNVEVSDVINLKKADEVVQHLMTCYPAEVVKPGELVIHFAPKEGSKAQDFVVRYNPSQLQAQVEKVKLEAMEDKGIITKWGDTIYRINLTAISPKMQDKMNFQIAARPKMAAL
jgi:hypothetical protein